MSLSKTNDVDLTETPHNKSSCENPVAVTRDVEMAQDSSTFFAALQTVESNLVSPEQQPEDISQLTLLGIPQELRNQIFGYVYDGPVDERIDLVVVSVTDAEGIAFAHEEDLPSKTPMLVCQQLCSEMRGMYTSAYRSFWTSNRFWVSRSPGISFDGNNLVLNRDLQRIQHLAIYDMKLGAIFGVGLDLGGAAPSILDLARISQHKHYGIMREQWLRFFATIAANVDPARRLEKQTGVRSEYEPLDPGVGQGLDTKELAEITRKFLEMLEIWKPRVVRLG